MLLIFFCCPYQSYIWFVLACLTAILGLCEWLWSFDTTTILIDFILVNSSDSSKGSLQDRIIVWLLITVKKNWINDSNWDFHEFHKPWIFTNLQTYHFIYVLVCFSSKLARLVLIGPKIREKINTNDQFPITILTLVLEFWRMRNK